MKISILITLRTCNQERSFHKLTNLIISSDKKKKKKKKKFLPSFFVHLQPLYKIDTYESFETFARDEQAEKHFERLRSKQIRSEWKANFSKRRETNKRCTSLRQARSILITDFFNVWKSTVSSGARRERERERPGFGNWSIVTPDGASLFPLMVG